MSLGYADKLKQRKNLGGQLGWPEHHDSLPEVAQKAKDLLELLRSSPECSIFAFTGAGISTSIGIPDFRGPKGIWTLRKKNQPVPPMQVIAEFFFL
jgi:mono-ADP-ribosyltransferase sirtuin 6